MLLVILRDFLKNIVHCLGRCHIMNPVQTLINCFYIVKFSFCQRGTAIDLFHVPNLCKRFNLFRGQYCMDPASNSKLDAGEVNGSHMLIPRTR